MYYKTKIICCIEDLLLDEGVWQTSEDLQEGIQETRFANSLTLDQVLEFVSLSKGYRIADTNLQSLSGWSWLGCNKTNEG